MANKEVPPALRKWFLIHFMVDILFAIPLIIIPDYFLRTLGWQVVDPVSARLVAAALFAIGIESLISYKSSIDNYIGMLNLKILWSLGAVLGLIISIIHMDHGRPIAMWLLLLVFLAFNALWVYWRVKLFRLKEPVNRSNRFG